jgi:hypothetical protein
VPLFDVTGANQLAGEQRVKQPAEIYSQVVLEKLRIKLRVVSNLYRPVRRQQPTQWLERWKLRKVSVTAKSIEVNNVDSGRGGELDQPQTANVWIKLCGFGVESYCLVGCERFNCLAKLFFVLY